MAQTAPTTLSGFAGFLTPEMSEPIFDEVRRRSTVQQLVRQRPLGISGQAIPVTTVKPTASWVAEGGQKQATAGGKSLVTMSPKKLAAISVVSAEVVRANPGGYIQDLQADLAEAFAVAFDAAALHGTNTPFGVGNYVGATTKSVTLGTATAANGGIFADLNAGLNLLVAGQKRLTGFAFDPVAEPIFNAAVDLNGRPLFVDSPTSETAEPVRAGRLLGRPALIGEGVANAKVVGFGGNWEKAAWGVVGGISYNVSTQASVTLDGELVSLFENNLVAILAEAEYGWICHDPQAFAKYVTA